MVPIMAYSILFSLLFWTILVPGLAEEPDQSEDSKQSTVTALGKALNQRNVIMKDLAGYEFRHNLPAQLDPQKKEEMMKNIIAAASKQNLDPKSVRPLASAMLEVGEEVRAAFISGWKEAPLDPTFRPEDIDTVRHKLNEASTKIIKLIHDQLENGGFKEGDREKIKRLLTAPHLTEAHKKLLIDSMFKVKSKEDEKKN